MMNASRQPTRFAPKQSFTRPADTNAYTAGDVVADSTSAAALLTFEAVTPGDGYGTVLDGLVFTSSANVAAAKPDLELWLFNVAPASYGNDNEAFAPTDAEVQDCIGIVAIPVASFKVGLSGADAAGNAVCDVRGIGLNIAGLTGNKMYGVLVARNAYVPISGEVFTILLKFAD
jgi:hypothetical protein